MENNKSGVGYYTDYIMNNKIKSGALFIIAIVAAIFISSFFSPSPIIIDKDGVPYKEDQSIISDASDKARKFLGLSQPVQHLEPEKEKGWLSTIYDYKISIGVVVLVIVAAYYAYYNVDWSKFGSSQIDGSQSNINPMQKVSQDDRL